LPFSLPYDAEYKSIKSTVPGNYELKVHIGSYFVGGGTYLGLAIDGIMQ
jgi:hypothetical protein